MKYFKNDIDYSLEDESKMIAPKATGTIDVIGQSLAT